MLNPNQWQSSVDFRESLISWGILVLVLEQQSTEKISEAMKIAVILEHAPTRIAESLRLSGLDVRNNYPAMRDAMRNLYESTRECPTNQTYGQIGSDVIPMDVSAVLYGKGKFGKKGKDKKGRTKDSKNAKSKVPTEYFDGECGYCGKWGHKKNDCWEKSHDEKGRGKGQAQPRQQEQPRAMASAPSRRMIGTWI